MIEGFKLINNKVIELNLEHGSPIVSLALQKLKNALPTYKGQGFKAVIVIHGYGSTGTGGGIKTAVRSCLGEGGMSGIVRMSIGGEDWVNNKRAALAICKSLESYERRISGNSGITVVILK